MRKSLGTKKYASDEVKERAIKKVIELQDQRSRHAVDIVAKELGLGRSTVFKWIKDAGGIPARKTPMQLTDNKLLELEEENKSLRMLVMNLQRRIEGKPALELKSFKNTDIDKLVKIFIHKGLLDLEDLYSIQK